MKSEKAKILKEREVITVDTDGNEVKSSTTRDIIRPVEPDFVKVYLNCVAMLAEYPSSLNPILIALLKRMTYAGDDSGGQVIYANKHLKANVAKECGVTVKRVDQALSEFVKSECLFRVMQGVYSANANYFGRGSWRDIEKLREIQANLRLNKNEKEFSVNFLIADEIVEEKTETPQNKSKRSGSITEKIRQKKEATK